MVSVTVTDTTTVFVVMSLLPETASRLPLDLVRLQLHCKAAPCISHQDLMGWVNEGR
jgi:hypothetical protein